MSCFAHPKLAGIDDALVELEPVLKEFARSHGFTHMRSHEGSFNVPHRRLYRELSGIYQEIYFVIALPMPERLERGFYAAIPCTLYIAACDRATQGHYHTAVFEAQPFDLAKGALSRHLEHALVTIESCTAEFITAMGGDSHAA